MHATPSLLYLVCACCCAAVAVVTDLRSRRIPNWLTGPAFLFALLLHAVTGGVRDAGLALLSGLIAGGVFLVFFLAGGMGAGDVKLMAAVGALAGLHPLRHLLIATALLGALAAVVTALLKGRLRETVGNAGALLAHHQAHGLVAHPEFNVQNGATLRLPYAIPIAGGCLAVLLLTFFGVSGL